MANLHLGPAHEPRRNLRKATGLLVALMLTWQAGDHASAGDSCAHDPCYQGAALQSSCSPCVTEICNANAACCSTTWNLVCALATDDLCTRCEPLCGDATEDRRLTAPDALAALRTAVGTGDCANHLCDFNGDGDILSTDALLILRVSVGAPGNPSCPDAPDLYQYMVHQLWLPNSTEESEAFAFNIDDDVHGDKDNQLGSVIQLLALQGLTLQDDIEEALLSGQLVELVSLATTDLTDDTEASWQMHIGEPEASPPVFDGTDVFTIAGTGPEVEARIQAGRLSAEQTVGSTETTPFRFKLFPNTSLLEFPIVGLHVDVSVTAEGCSDGRIGGAIPNEFIQEELLPAWAAAIEEGIPDPCHAGAAMGDYSSCDDTSETYLNLFDEDPQDGHVSVDEVRENNFVKTLFAPDVAVLDENDAYVPSATDEPDALSFGLGFECVAATFDE